MPTTLTTTTTTATTTRKGTARKSLEPANPRTIDEARLIANIERRARTLWEDGYSYAQSDILPHWFSVESPKGNLYSVNLKAETCTCECHEHYNLCKHLLAVKWEMERDQQMVADYEAEQAVREAAECSTWGCDYAEF